MLGKLTGKASGSVAQGATRAVAQEDGRIELFAAAKLDGSNLPRAPASAFRKRPVRLDYDKNEFYSFRLPSENAFLRGSFDKNAIFGSRHGLQHSPHIQAQIDVDTRILLGLVGLSFLMVTTNFKSNGKMMNLRENFRTATYGRFEADDFVKKQ